MLNLIARHIHPDWHPGWSSLLLCKSSLWPRALFKVKAVVDDRGTIFSFGKTTNLSDSTALRVVAKLCPCTSISPSMGRSVGKLGWRRGFGFGGINGYAKLAVLLPSLIAAIPLGTVSGEILRQEDGGFIVVQRPSMPLRGETQNQVLARHGEPLQRVPTVGGDTPTHPPITRWDYDQFYVIFERTLVIHSVSRSLGPTPE